MPRTARIKAPECTYHVIIRGNNRQNIFRDDSDKMRFLRTIKKFKFKYDFLLYAYVLMDNHIHMIINSNGEDISKIMQSINISYTYYFNKKYGMIGHLFQDRFKSKIVSQDKYITNLSKYIHNNPVRAGIVAQASDYQWSSCRSYISEECDHFQILDSDFILGYFSGNKSRAKTLYLAFMLKKDEDQLEDEKPFSVEEKIKNNSSSGVDIGKIIKIISGIYKIPADDLILKNNRKHSLIRNECLYIVRLKSKENIKFIGDKFGGICPSSVSYGINKTIEKMMEDENTFNRINQILESINF